MIAIRLFFSVSVGTALLSAQDAQAIRAAMQPSVRQQRTAAQVQARSSGRSSRVQTTFPAIPIPQCEPVPEADLNSLAAAAGDREHVDPQVIREVVRQESGGQPCVVSPKGAQGLMQLMPQTQLQLGVKNPFDPAESLGAGAKLLRMLLDRYQGDLKLALSAYNAGPEAVDRAQTIPNIAETQGYVNTILQRLGR